MRERRHSAGRQQQHREFAHLPEQRRPHGIPRAKVLYHLHEGRRGSLERHRHQLHAGPMDVLFAAGDHLLDERRRDFAEEEPPQVGSALDAAWLEWLDRKAEIRQHSARLRHRRLDRRRDRHAVEPLH